MRKVKKTTPAGGVVHCRERRIPLGETRGGRKKGRRGVRTKRRRRRKETLHPGYLLSA